jgi:hypothetical protein
VTGNPQLEGDFRYGPPGVEQIRHLAVPFVS